MVFGYVFTPTLLNFIKTPTEIFDDSWLYLKIYTAGVPFVLFYNVATGIFSALGDYMGSCGNFIGQMGFFALAHVWIIIYFIRRYINKVEPDGKLTSKAKGYMAMVFFCAVMMAVQGKVADMFGYINSYWVVVICAAYVLFYAQIGSRPTKK